MKLSKAITDFGAWRSFKVTGHTVVRYESALKIFCLTFGDPDVEVITIQHVMAYLTQMEKLGWKRNGITITCLALRTLFNYLEMQKVKCMSGDLIPIPKKEYNIPRVANEKDFKKLVHAIPVKTQYNKYNNIRNMALIHLIWDTGARQGEITSLNLKDLVFNKDGTGTAIIKTEKSRGRRPIREIFWTPRTTKHIKRWLKAREVLQTQFPFIDRDALFISIMKTATSDSRGRRMCTRNVCEVFRTISNRAGLPTVFNAHSARHRMGRKIITMGGSNADVSNILGHSHTDSSYIYTMMWGKELKKRYTHFQRK